MKLINSKELLEKYKISRSTLHRLEKKGLPYIGEKRMKRYNIDQVNIWLQNYKEGIENLIIGEIYDNITIAKIFGCGVQGGMRRSHTTNTLTIFSDYTKNLYKDIWKEDILFYTGMGTQGDQQLNGNQNKTLFNSNTLGVKVHLFETFFSGEHIYRGPVVLADEPYIDNQEDINGHNRKVWIFPLKLVIKNYISQSLIRNIVTEEKNKSEGLSINELKNKAKLSKGTSKRTVISNIYVRDMFVATYVKKRANGICDLCSNPAPFSDVKGNPYLENHHIPPLSEGGEDTIYKCVALCPTCHRKIHILKNKTDLESLNEKLKYYQNNNL